MPRISRRSHTRREHQGEQANGNCTNFHGDGHFGCSRLPRRTYAVRVAMPPFLELRYVPNHPAQYYRVRHLHVPLSHHGHQVSVARPVGDVPRNAEFDDLSIQRHNHGSWHLGRRVGSFWTPRRSPDFHRVPAHAPEPDEQHLLRTASPASSCTQAFQPGATPIPFASRHDSCPLSWQRTGPGRRSQAVT